MSSDASQARPPAVPESTRRRPALTRDQVLTTALKIIDEGGVEVAGLGAEGGVSEPFGERGGVGDVGCVTVFTYTTNTNGLLRAR